MCEGCEWNTVLLVLPVFVLSCILAAPLTKNIFADVEGLLVVFGLTSLIMYFIIERNKRENRPRHRH